MDTNAREASTHKCFRVVEGGELPGMEQSALRSGSAIGPGFYRPGADISLIYHPLLRFWHRTPLCPAPNGAKLTGKGGLWLIPRNARMQPVPASRPIMRSIAATIVPESEANWRSPACAVTPTVAATSTNRPRHSTGAVCPRVSSLKLWGTHFRRREGECKTCVGLWPPLLE